MNCCATSWLSMRFHSNLEKLFESELAKIVDDSRDCVEGLQCLNDHDAEMFRALGYDSNLYPFIYSLFVGEMIIKIIFSNVLVKLKYCCLCYLWLCLENSPTNCVCELVGRGVNDWKFSVSVSLKTMTSTDIEQNYFNQYFKTSQSNLCMTLTIFASISSGLSLNCFVKNIFSFQKYFHLNYLQRWL